jgi:hypothetical protein
MVDKGKVLRNVYKKKLAEYVQTQEQKGEQDVHSETVPTTKSPVLKVVKREPINIDLEFFVYKKKAKTPVATPISIQANLSKAERKKLINTINSINESVRLGSAQAIIDRVNALIKRLIPESANYSVEYTDALLKVIKEMNKNVENIVPSNQKREAETVVKNVFNQVEELLEERLAELKPEMEEGESPAEVSIPATKQGEVAKRLPPPPPESLKIETIQPIETEAQRDIKYTTPPDIFFVEDRFTSANRINYNTNRTEIISKFNDTFVKLPNKTEQDEYVKMYKKRIQAMGTANTGDIDEIKNKFITDSNQFLTDALARASSSSGTGMRKTKQNTYRGYTGYGSQTSLMGCGDAGQVQFSTTPAVDKGFATAPMNANSPFGQPAYRSKQSNSIPKYLNFNVIPNERGNFAVIED